MESLQEIPLSGYEFLYHRREPEKTLLYKVISENYATFISQLEIYGDRPLPFHVKSEFEEYLKCGILSNGFLRIKCDSCKTERLVGFSCKQRGFCPGCLGRRMAETSAHLVDSVIPKVPVRQWVISFPRQLRYWLAYNPKLQTKIIEIVIRVLQSYYRKKSKQKILAKQAKTGFVTLIQRFGSAVNLNIHLHILALEGLFLNENAKFIPVAQPTDEEVKKVVKVVAERLIKFLQKKGYLKTFDDGYAPEGFFDDDLFQNNAAFATCVSASVGYKIGFGENAGQPIRKVGSGWGNMDDEPFPTSRRCFLVNGFSLHANTFIKAGNIKRLEQLCNYILRPPIAVDRMSKLPDGNILYQLKRPYSDGTSHIEFTQMEFMEKLVALVPPPRANTIRYHGVLASNCKIRSMIVPGIQEKEEKKDCACQNKKYDWASLLKRVFKIDILNCPCGGKLKIVSAITESKAINKILTHLGLETGPPERSPPRIYQEQFGFVQV